MCESNEASYTEHPKSVMESAKKTFFIRDAQRVARTPKLVSFTTSADDQRPKPENFNPDCCCRANNQHRTPSQRKLTQELCLMLRGHLRSLSCIDSRQGRPSQVPHWNMQQVSVRNLRRRRTGAAAEPNGGPRATQTALRSLARSEELSLYVSYSAQATGCSAQYFCPLPRDSHDSLRAVVRRSTVEHRSRVFVTFRREAGPLH